MRFCGGGIGHVNQGFQWKIGGDDGDDMEIDEEKSDDNQSITRVDEMEGQNSTTVVPMRGGMDELDSGSDSNLDLDLDSDLDSDSMSTDSGSDDSSSNSDIGPEDGEGDNDDKDDGYASL